MATAVATLLLAGALAGCTTNPVSVGLPVEHYAPPSFDGSTWPDLHGAKVTILAYEAFQYAFGDAKSAFENMTNGTVELLTEPDSGKVLERAVREKGDPSFDVVYGVDNVLYGKAVREGVFEAYEPALAARIDPSLRFTEAGLATAVDHGFIAVNVDPRSNLTVRNLGDVKAHAAQFVTEDPRTSTPGLGFLLATVATYGDEDPGTYDYLDYWNDLFAGGVLVTADWTDAYANHFSGGYGQFQEGSKHDKAIVTSYTTSPAYEMFYGYRTRNANVLAPKSTFHQVQAMGIANGTGHRLAAEAWMEFALSDGFQSLVAKDEAIYPVVAGMEVEEVYLGRDPRPGSFEDAGFAPGFLDTHVEGWLRAWTDAYERARAR